MWEGDEEDCIYGRAMRRIVYMKEDEEDCLYWRNEEDCLYGRNEDCLLYTSDAADE